MIHRLVVRNLLHRPVRTGLTVLAVAVEVMMIVLMVGVSEGLLTESLRRTRGVGADILIRPQFSGAALSTADISDKLPAMLTERYPQIESALGASVYTPGNVQTITGVDWQAFDAMSGGIAIFEGRAYAAPYEAVVDELYARQEEVSVGDTIELMSREFELVGIVETGKMSRVFIPPETMSDLQGWQGRVSQVYLKLDDPGKTRELIEELRALLPNRSVISVEDFLAALSTDVRRMSSQFVNIIISIAVSIGFIVVMLAMYTAILERTREIGILKAIGASRGVIGSIVMRETLVVSLIGIVLGYGLSLVCTELIAIRYPLVPIIFIPEWLAGAAALTILGSLAGAAYPAWQAAKADPCEILSYE
ncbi:MAG: ABC transporter permease [Bryobacterales bacterium]|nr:ABC transporter permease [Bryobacterales bacterium]